MERPSLTSITSSRVQRESRMSRQHGVHAQWGSRAAAGLQTGVAS